VICAIFVGVDRVKFSRVDSAGDGAIQGPVNAVDAKGPGFMLRQAAKADLWRDQADDLAEWTRADGRGEFIRIHPATQLTGDATRQHAFEHRGRAEVEARPEFVEQAGAEQTERGVADIGVTGGVRKNEHGEMGLAGRAKRAETGSGPEGLGLQEIQPEGGDDGRSKILVVNRRCRRWEVAPDLMRAESSRTTDSIVARARAKSRARFARCRRRTP